MNVKTFDALVEEARYRQDEILESKGRDYTRGSDDRLANFKRWGAELDIPPEKVLAVYMGKHIDSIIAYIKTGGDSQSEPIQGRLDDNHNYLYLLEALLAEQPAKPKAKKKKRVRKQ